ncbi:MAG: RNA polymerase sigma factor [Acidimicrobiia bacterium]|nr:MAG: RNA polymerase sigma factor [Acidimicrobiia bacterium]
MTMAVPIQAVALSRARRQGGPVEGVVAAEDLLGRARDGDLGAFAQFYDEEAGQLLGWFKHRTAAADVAADLCAETFAVVLKTLDRYEAGNGPAPQAWLYGIARNQFRHWLRRQRVQDRARQQLGIYLQLPQADDLDLVELRADLERAAGPLDGALAALSEPTRAAVLLRVVDELPYADVAARLECSEGAARVRVSRGLAQLFDQLAGEGS